MVTGPIRVIGEEDARRLDAAAAPQVDHDLGEGVRRIIARARQELIR